MAVAPDNISSLYFASKFYPNVSLLLNSSLVSRLLEKSGLWAGRPSERLKQKIAD